MKANYYKSNVHVQNGDRGIQPGIFIVEGDIVYLVTITPNHRFEISNEGKLGEKYKYNTAGSIEWCGDNSNNDNINDTISSEEIHNIVDQYKTNQLNKQMDAIKNIISDNKEEKQNFTWDPEKEDPELYKNGVTILWVGGRTKSLQNFVEKLSEKINSKCDFSWSAGRAHVDCFKEAKEKALEAIYDEEFMSQFIVPYSRETFDNGTYFEIFH